VNPNWNNPKGPKPSLKAIDKFVQDWLRGKIRPTQWKKGNWMKKPRKPRWGGLPDSLGFWEWKWSRSSKSFLVLWVDSYHRVHFPVPKENTIVGYFFEPVGRTVRTIGGIWGRKIDP
jgi:hypothetical protein